MRDKAAYLHSEAKLSEGSPIRADLIQALAAMPDEAFDWFVNRGMFGFPDERDRLHEDSQAAITALRSVVKGYFERGPNSDGPDNESDRHTLALQIVDLLRPNQAHGLRLADAADVQALLNQAGVSMRSVSE